MKFPMIWRTGCGLLVIATLTVVCFFLRSCYVELRDWRASLDPQRDPADYPVHLAEWKDGGGRFVSHFPDPPLQSDQVFHYYFQRGFLQGGSTFHVGIMLDSSDTVALLSAFSFVSMEEFPTPPPKPAFFPVHYDDVDPLEDFEFFYLEARDQARDWDKGFIYGVGVSPDRRRVVYFAESC